MEFDDIDSFETMMFALGKKLVGFRRMYFYFENEIIKEGASVEFEFDEGFALYFRGISGGAKLKIVDEAWDDPYSNYSAEEFDREKFEYGLHQRVELICDDPYAHYANKKLISATPLTNEYDFMLGVELEFEDVEAKLTVFTSWDEDFVVFGDNSLSLSQAHLTAREDLKAALPAP